MYTLPSSKTKPLKKVVNINGKEVEMEIDTEASVSVMTHTEYKRLWSLKNRLPLHAAGTKLKKYTGGTIKIYGTCEVVVNHQGDEEKLPLVIVESERPNLLRRDWLIKLKLDWHMITLPSLDLTTLIAKYILQNKLGTIKGVSARIVVEETATPTFCGPRPVPFALHSKVNKELEKLESMGVLEKVEFADWAAPIIAVLKDDRNVRICGDYKMTINKVLKVDLYLLPRVEDLFTPSPVEGLFQC